MFGAFKSRAAAFLAAEAYALETGESYVVMTKVCDPNTECEQTWYQPVAWKDTEAAEKDGYVQDE